MNARKLFLVALFLAAILSANADELDRYILAQMEDQHIPGLAMAVLREGKAVRSRGYGYADIEQKISVTPDTVFQLQSITKSFTATAVMMLVEDGKLSVEDKISKFLDGLPGSWQDITISHLLTHTSGIKDFINEPTVDLARDLEPWDVILSLEKLPLNFQPGERYAYSNTGYHLLGMVVEKITGDTWQNFLRSRILKPLKMKRTDLNSAQCKLAKQALGYTWRSNRYDRGAYVAPTILGYAGGGILSTVADLAKWDHALLTDRLISRSSLEQMWTPARLRSGNRTEYGFGWGLGDHRGFPVAAHGGAHMTGFKTHFQRYIKQALTVIVLCNSRQANPGPIASGIAGFYLPELQLSRLKEREDPSPGRGEALKKALQSLAAREECSSVTPEFFANYSKSSQRAGSLGERLKGMKSFVFLGGRDVSGDGIERYGVAVNEVCFYRLTTPRESRYYTFYLAKDGKVASYQSSVD